MSCPHCGAASTTEQTDRTVLGYRKFRCQACQRLFNERTGTPFNFLEYPTDLVFLVVVWRLRYKLSLRDLAEMCLIRGFTFTHEAVRNWEARFAPLMAERLRAKRRGRGGGSWYADETYVKVHGRWCYLYRAIDREGNLIDARQSETRDLEAAKQFFVQALAVIGKPPQRVTTDGHTAYPRAIRETLGKKVLHRCSPYLNSRLEQDHRGINLRIPTDVATETDNPSTVPLSWLPTRGVIVGPDHDVLEPRDFRLLRDTLGAYIVTDAPALVRRALRVPASEPGIW